jgi:anti-anti-sigma regulatory factor
MLRIVEEQTTNNSTTLRLDGRIAGQWVEVLRSSCEQIFQSNGRVTLDLAGVTFADHYGVQLLRQLGQQQVALINSSPFLQEQMKHPTNGLSTSGPASE